MRDCGQEPKKKLYSAAFIKSAKIPSDMFSSLLFAFDGYVTIEKIFSTNFAHENVRIETTEIVKQQSHRHS